MLFPCQVRVFLWALDNPNADYAGIRLQHSVWHHIRHPLMGHLQRMSIHSLYLDISRIYSPNSATISQAILVQP